uniref:Uncharacterized protein n=1 Tax=Glossina pallidipes TaxID=7398 RepID=A0A1B0A2Y4_GLOPL
MIITIDVFNCFINDVPVRRPRNTVDARSMIAQSCNRVECSKCLKSNIRTEPSAPTEANISRPPPARENAISYTSLSWAISCVFTWPATCVRPCGCPVSKPHIVQVVSIEEVPTRLGSTSFQSNEVSGAQKSLFLLLLSTHSSRVSGSPARQTPLNSLVSSSRLIIWTLLLYSSIKLPNAKRNRLSGRTLQFIEYNGHGAKYL